MLFRQMRICVPKKINRAFIERARAAFPKETLGYLLGRTDENMTLQVEEIYFPENIDKHTSTGGVDVQHRWFQAARKRARQIKGIILGDIHSHPYTTHELLVRRLSPDCSPSECDLERYKVGLVQGICLMRESKNGNIRIRTKYWGPVVPVAEVVKKEDI